VNNFLIETIFSQLCSRIPINPETTAAALQGANRRCDLSTRGGALHQLNGVITTRKVEHAHNTRTHTHIHTQTHTNTRTHTRREAGETTTSKT